MVLLTSNQVDSTQAKAMASTEGPKAQMSHGFDSLQHLEALPDCLNFNKGNISNHKLTNVEPLLFVKQ